MRTGDGACRYTGYAGIRLIDRNKGSTLRFCGVSLMKKLLFTSVLLFICLSAALADDDGQHHHEALTEQQLGTVHFPVSCAAREQKPFERGVALLHSFWYEEAEKEFAQITKDDPTC